MEQETGRLTETLMDVEQVTNDTNRETSEGCRETHPVAAAPGAAAAAPPGGA